VVAPAHELADSPLDGDRLQFERPLALDNIPDGNGKLAVCYAHRQLPAVRRPGQGLQALVGRLEEAAKSARGRIVDAERAPVVSDGQPAARWRPGERRGVVLRRQD